MTTARCDCCVKLTSGQTHTVSGRALISTSSRERSTGRPARAMASLLPQSANAIRTTTVRGVNIWMSAAQIRIAVCKESVSTSADLLCHVNSATANLAGLVRAATKVSLTFDIWPQSLDMLIIFILQNIFTASPPAESPIKSTDIDFSLYTTKTLTPDFKIHWRILKEQKEIEMALVVNGTSWVGFGWRPRSLTAECRKFPLLQEGGASHSSPEPSSEPAAESAAAEPEPESSSEPKSEPESTSEPSSEPESTSEPVSEPETSSEPKSEPQAATAEPKRGGKALEPLALGSYKSSRISALPAASKQSKQDEYTVSTSVSYRISSVAGRKKRAAQKGNLEKRIC